MNLSMSPRPPRASTRAATTPRRCAICGRRPDVPLRWLDEGQSVPAEPRAWALCEACLDAVRAEMARAGLRTPYRVRIAVAMVASERVPGARRRRDGSWRHRGWYAPRGRLRVPRFPRLSAAWIVALALEPAMVVLIIMVLVLVHR